MLQEWLRFFAGLVTTAFYALVSSVSLPPTLSVTMPPGPARSGETVNVALRIRCDGFAPLREDIFRYFDLTLVPKSKIPSAPAESYFLEYDRFTWRPGMRWCWHETVTGVFPLPPLERSGNYSVTLKFLPHSGDADEQERLRAESPPASLRVLAAPKARMRHSNVCGVHHTEADGC